MTLKSLLIEHFDSNRERFKTDPHILINVAFIHGSEPAFAENVIGTEALRDGLQLVERKGDDVGVKQGILRRILEVPRRRGIAQIRYRPVVALLPLAVFRR